MPLSHAKCAMHSSDGTIRSWGCGEEVLPLQSGMLDGGGLKPGSGRIGKKEAAEPARSTEFGTLR